MYDPTGAADNLRTHTGLSLAWWHSYKWATKRIMVVYAGDFIAPYFHYMYPDKQFSPMKQSHPANCTYLSYMRLAYPYFRDQLQAALRRPLLFPRQKTILTNLLNLLEYFIPVVSFLWRVYITCLYNVFVHVLILSEDLSLGFCVLLCVSANNLFYTTGSGLLRRHAVEKHINFVQTDPPHVACLYNATKC